MPAIYAIFLSISLLFQNLTFTTPHTWSFTGEVTEIRQTLVMGLHARIALVKSIGFEAWVILRTNSQSDELPEIVLGDAAVGDLVRVSISGPHVTKNGVDWDACEPLYSNYCRQGWLYDTGPIAGDWQVPLSPSNEMIHFEPHYASTEYPLFWNTEVLQRAPACQHETHPSGAKGCRKHSGAGCATARRRKASLCHLAGPAHARLCAVPE